MKNFPVKVSEDTIIDGENMKGKTLWISRACTVAVFMFLRINKVWHVLANKRGSGCPDYVGYWSCPCGYVDYNETIVDAAHRELYEESGIDPCDLILDSINDNPEGNQNITFRYRGVLYWPTLPKLSDQFSEPNEIEEQKWIPLKDVGLYNWAFNHDEIIFEVFKNLSNYGLFHQRS